jgi:4-hydroxybenzoyl-CoA thioesterase
VIVYERAIRFEEVDAAAIVFFARFVNYAHEAMEHFFSRLDGGYAGLIVGRRIGFPAVHLDVAFAAPVRFGDALRIETRVARVGNRSAVFHYRMLNAAT